MELTDVKTVELTTRADWRAWLAANHDRESEVWLVYHKKHTGRESVEYGASVEEALCYGWVDSLIKKLDDDRYARKFTPRKDDSAWSPSNRKRVERMTGRGLMTEHGLAKVEAAKRTGKWDAGTTPPKLTFEMSAEFEAALRESPRAAQTFRALAPTHQKPFLAWIEAAKRPETKEKRIRESIRLLEEGKRLGLK